MDGSRIRKFRIERNYSQKDLAALLNVSVRTISRWERNSNAPNPDELSRIAKLIGITEEELLCVDNDPVCETNNSVLNRISDSVDNLVTGQDTINESLIANRDEDNKRQDELISELRSQNELFLSKIAAYEKLLDNRKVDLFHKRIRTVVVVVTCIIILALVIWTWVYWRSHGFKDEIIEGSEDMDTPSYFEIDDGK